MLYIVSTPIGNLEDITLRAIRTLKEVDYITAEDTRHTQILLNKYEIKNHVLSYHSYSSPAKLEKIIDLLKEGKSVALVSDAGTPCISDPGIRLVNAAIQKQIKVVPIPGVNAAITALSISGLPTDSFVFEGFLPQKKGRQKKLTELSQETRTIVLYESVYRIEKLLDELNQYMPNRFVSVCRELTKMFEEVWQGYPSEIISKLNVKTIKGEFVVVISPVDWKDSHDRIDK